MKENKKTRIVTIVVSVLILGTMSVSNSLLRFRVQDMQYQEQLEKERIRRIYRTQQAPEPPRPIDPQHLREVSSSSGGGALSKAMANNLLKKSNIITANEQSTSKAGWKEYISDPTNIKSHGRQVRVEYPQDWLAMPGNSTHNLYKFSKRESKQPPRGLSCVINIVSVGDAMPDSEYVALFSDLQTNPGIQRLVLGGTGRVVFSMPTSFNGAPAVILRAETKQTVSGVDVYSKTQVMSIGYRNTMLNLSCQTMAASKAKASSMFSESKGTFDAFFDSFQILK